MAEKSNILRRVSLAPALLLAMLLAGGVYTVAPAAIAGWRVLMAGDDPVALTDVQLDEALTPARFAREIDAALDDDDPELAQSFVALGAARGLAPSSVQQERLAARLAAGDTRAARDFADGFVHGVGKSGAGMTGALVGDLTGYGDARDLWREAGRLARGEEADHVVMGAAAAGLVLSAAAWSSLGAALPARGGLTVVKTAQKAGRLSQPLVTSLTAAATRTIDREALAASFTAATRLDIEAARLAAAKAMRTEALATFRALGEDAAGLYRAVGARGVSQVFAVAGDAGEVRAAARLVSARGGKARAIIATLGRGALGAGAVIAAAFDAVVTLAALLFGLALAARALGVALARIRLR